jgi:hypothetical protein
MGNCILNRIKTANDNICLICKKNIDTINFVTCVRCNHSLHNECEEIDRNMKGYCECPNPNCQYVGSLGTVNEKNISTLHLLKFTNKFCCFCNNIKKTSKK